MKQVLDVGSSCIISDENILGDAHDCLSVGRFYPFADRRLRSLANISADRQVEIYLSVREYSGFLASMFVELLRWERLSSQDALLNLDRTIAGAWVELVERIHAVFPKAKLIIWKF